MPGCLLLSLHTVREALRSGLRPTGVTRVTLAGAFGDRRMLTASLDAEIAVVERRLVPPTSLRRARR